MCVCVSMDVYIIRLYVCECVGMCVCKGTCVCVFMYGYL